MILKTTQQHIDKQNSMTLYTTYVTKHTNREPYSYMELKLLKKKDYFFLYLRHTSIMVITIKTIAIPTNQ